MKLPNIPADIFSFSAVVVGFILIGDATANEQNALGNWLMLVAQVLCTNAVYLQVLQERNNNSNNSQNNNLENDTVDTVEMLKKMVSALNQEIDNLKSKI